MEKEKVSARLTAPTARVDVESLVVFGPLPDRLLANCLSFVIDIDEARQLEAVSCRFSALVNSLDAWDSVDLAVVASRVPLRLVGSWCRLGSLSLCCEGCSAVRIMDILQILEVKCPKVNIKVRGAWDVSSAGDATFMSFNGARVIQCPYGCRDHACVATNSPLKLYSDGSGWYFEVRLSGAAPAPHFHESKVLLGVTAHIPIKSTFENSAHLSEFPDSFCLLANGELCVNGMKMGRRISSFSSIDFEDIVGFFVTRIGSIVVYKKSRSSGYGSPYLGWQRLGEVEAGVPVHMPLFGIAQPRQNIYALELRL